MSDNWKLTVPTRRTNSIRNPIFGRSGNHAAYGSATATRTAGAGKFGANGLVVEDSAAAGGVYVNCAPILGANDTFAASFLDTTTAAGGETPATSTGIQYISTDFGRGIATDIALTNLISNPSIETNTTGYASDGTVALSRSSEEASEGTYSLKWVYTSGSANVYYILSPDFATNTDHYFKVRAKRASGGVISSTQIRPLINWGSGNTGLLTTATYTPLGDGWYEIAVPFTSGATVTISIASLTVQAGYTSENWYFDCWQVTATDHNPAYFDGSFGTGYAWSGTANASTSTKVATDFDYSGVLTTGVSAEGGVTVRFRSDRREIGLVQTIFTNTSASPQTIHAYLEAGIGNTLRVYCDYGASSNFSAEQLSVGTWYTLTMKWNSTTVSIQIDSEAAETFAHGGVVSSGATTLAIGSNGGSDALSGAIDFIYVQDSYTPTAANWAATVWQSFEDGVNITALSDFGATAIDSQMSNGNNGWAMAYGNGTGPISALVSRTNSENERTIAAVQVEELTSSTQQASTLIYGDIGEGYYWTGAPNASPSVRLETAVGGVEYGVQTEYDMCISADTGAGMVPLSVNISNTPGRAGGVLSSIDVKPRAFEWRGSLSGSTNLASFHAMRQKLIRGVNSLTTNPPTPRRLSYVGANVDKYIDAYYVSGLELGATLKVQHEDLDIRWEAADPFFYGYGNGQDVGTPFATIESKGMAIRSNGDWTTYQPVTSWTGHAGRNNMGFQTGVVYNGYIWIGGSFTVLNGNSWTNIVKYNLETHELEEWENTSAWSASSVIQKILLLPNQKLLVVGDFTCDTTFSAVTTTRSRAMLYDPSNGEWSTPPGYGTGANAAILDACFVQNEGVYIVGSFTTINGSAMEYAALMGMGIYGSAVSALGDNNPTVTRLWACVPHPSGTGVYIAGDSLTLWDADVVAGVFYWDGSAVDALNGGVSGNTAYGLLLASDGNLYTGTSPMKYYNGASWVDTDLEDASSGNLAELDGLVFGTGFSASFLGYLYWDGERVLSRVFPLAVVDQDRIRTTVVSYGGNDYILYMRYRDAGTFSANDIVAPAVTTIPYSGTAPAHLTAQLTINSVSSYRQRLNFVRNETSGEVVYIDDYFLTAGEVITFASSEFGLAMSSDLFGDISDRITTSSDSSMQLLPSNEEGGSRDNVLSVAITLSDISADDETVPDVDIVYTWRDTYLSQD